MLHARLQTTMFPTTLLLFLSIGILPTTIHSFPAFRDEIPNGLRSVYASDPIHHLTGGQSYWALGHINPHGGGKLNVFGQAFKAANYEWSLELCRADTDNDGESNGLELGDPCCVWSPGQTPMRQWGMSHPGIQTSFSNLTFDYDSLCLQKKGNNQFWNFYYQTQGDNGRTSMSPFKPVGQDISEWWALKLVNVKKNGGWMRTLFGVLNIFGSQSMMQSTRDLFTLLLAGVSLATLLTLALHHQCCCSSRSQTKKGRVSGDTTIQKGLTGWNHLQLFLVAVIYTDLMSGILHLVLDNPVMNTWPLIGPEALAFQGHHFDPTGVAKGPILDMVREDHAVIFLGMISFFLLRPSSSSLMTFSLWFGFLSHFMMASHRWSHTHPKYLHWSIKAAQKYGLIMTTEHHSKHHASYDCNFSIFNGWSNILFNKLIYVIHWRSPIWFFLLGVGILVPIGFTNPSTMQWCQRIPNRLFHWCMTRPAFFLPNSTPAQFCKGWVENKNKQKHNQQHNQQHQTVQNMTRVEAKSTCNSYKEDFDTDEEVTNHRVAASEEGRPLYLEKETRSRPLSNFTLFFHGRNVTQGNKSRRMAARCAQIGGAVAVLLIVGSLVLRSLGMQAVTTGSKTVPAPPILVILHTACMSTAVLICSTTAVSHYAFVEPTTQSNKPAIRSRHRTCNMMSAALMVVGTVLILTHVIARHERVVRPRSSHMWLALFVFIGVAVQITAGVLKYAALKAGRISKRFKWHGEVGWVVYIGMLFTVNSGIVESGLFAAQTFLQMAIQIILIGPVGLGASHALGRLPAISFDMENPFSHIIREHLNATVPDFIVSWLTKNPNSCLRKYRPKRLIGQSHQDKQEDVGKAIVVRKVVKVLIVVGVLFVIGDAWYHST